MEKVKIKIRKDDYGSVYMNREDVLLFLYKYKDLLKAPESMIILLDDLIKKFSSLE
jgi:hypothetical protein